MASREGKKVVEEISGWFRIFDDGSVDRTWTGPIEVLPLLEPVTPYSEPRDGVTLHDIPFDPPLRLYLPETASTDFDSRRIPILLHFHGGGFCISRPSWLMYHHFYARLARSIPAAVLSVFLPLAPEHRLPAAATSAYRALSFLQSLDATSSPKNPLVAALSAAGDISRVFLIGDSSGGNLVHDVAAAAGRDPAGLDPIRLAGAIELHPGFVRSDRTPSELETQNESPMLTIDMLDKFLNLGLPVGSTKDHPITCPMGPMAPPLETLVMPPVMVAVAERDLIRDTNLEYCEAMQGAGKSVEVVVNRGVGHSFYLNKFAVESDPIVGERTEELIRAIKSFVDRH